MIKSVTLQKGIITYTADRLLFSAGEYLFEVQSYDKEIEAGETSTIRCHANKKVAFLIYHVDDLEGWYKVERLPKCGEPASKYTEGARRYIKRTWEYTWEIGYLFSQYANSTDSTGASSTQLQFITIDPEIKKLHIQQGDYETSEDMNEFDPVKNELHIEYLYAAWADWWTHKRMFNRSVSK